MQLRPAMQADIANRVIDAAEGSPASETEEGNLDAGEGVWFGAASWSALLAEIEGLLKALEVLVAAMTASKMELNAPIPTAVLALLVVLVSASELALWLAKRDVNS